MRFSPTFILVVALNGACSGTEAQAPSAPQMPEQWKVISDVSFEPADIRPVAERLGAKLSALRNTTYEVAGEQVKLNTLVAASEEDADHVVAALGQIKPEEFFWRNGRIVYEFVGSDVSIPAIREARAQLTNR